MDDVKKLVRQAQKGDTAAFEQLVTMYQDRIYGLGYHLTGNYADAQDVAQEAFIRAYTALKGFRLEADFGTWLHRISVNVWINIKRKRRPSVSLDAPLNLHNGGEVQRELAATAETPDEAVARGELRDKVRGAMMELTDEHRAVLVLREIQGYAYDEIAEILECSLGTVKSRISRARRALREKLAETPAQKR